MSSLIYVVINVFIAILHLILGVHAGSFSGIVDVVVAVYFAAGGVGWVVEEGAGGEQVVVGERPILKTNLLFILSIRIIVFALKLDHHVAGVSCLILLKIPGFIYFILFGHVLDLLWFFNQILNFQELFKGCLYLIRPRICRIFRLFSVVKIYS